jgi:acyl dehydratase
MAIDPRYLMSMPPRIIEHEYTRRDCILYALGVGVGQPTADEQSDLQFVFEERLCALPTMVVVLAYPGFWLREPQYGVDWERVLHAEQSIEVHAPIPVEGRLRGEMKIDGIVDKGVQKGSLLYSTRRIYDQSTGVLLASVKQTAFLRGDGGCGNWGTPTSSVRPMPDSPCDFEMTLPTRQEQALLYRLSGDDNPLHIDPEVAHRAGLPRPILHGLCTFGIAGRALVKFLCSNEAARLTRMDCRFTAPVFPGETLTLRIWRSADGQVAFQMKASDRDVLVLDNGFAQLKVNATA